MSHPVSLANEPIFIIVSGLPASGKTSLARRLADEVGLPVIDKDDILEGLFSAHDVIDDDLRQRLSRQSDDIMAEQARGHTAAILVSFWQNPDQSDSSGTPSAWVRKLPGHIVEIHCKCTPEMAQRWFADRTRHAGHNDSMRAAAFLPLFGGLAERYPLNIGACVEVDSSAAIDLARLTSDITATLPSRSIAQPVV